jgi:5-methylcytosine-specific restriction enzyme A
LGVRNPAWSRDELIVALDLYFRVNPLHTSKSNPDIIEASRVLNQLDIHLNRPDAQRFRNANGVYMKLCNFLRFDPAVEAKGLTSGSRLEEHIWNEFASDRQRLQRVAQAIRNTLKTTQTDAALAEALAEEEPIEAPEGRVLTRLHRVRERNPKLVRLKKEYALDVFGKLSCEACTFDFLCFYGTHGDGYIECHHTKPISFLEPNEKTKLTELALVCSNCHRMLHRGARWLTVPELHVLCGPNGFNVGI